MKTVRTLPVKLTEDELSDRSKSLAKHYQDRAVADLQRKEVAAQLAATIKKHDSQISILAQAINTGTEWREVTCEWQYDWPDGKKRLFREDTEELIETKEITAEERQGKIGAEA